MTLSEHFTVLMKRQNLTRKQLAKLAGITEVTLRSIMEDNPDCKMATYEKVANALGVQIKYTVE